MSIKNLNFKYINLLKDKYSNKKINYNSHENKIIKLVKNLKTIE